MPSAAPIDELCVRTSSGDTGLAIDVDSVVVTR
jgi:hypothetical protein